MQFAKYLNQEKAKKNKFFINMIKRQTGYFHLLSGKSLNEPRYQIRKRPWGHLFNCTTRSLYNANEWISYYWYMPFAIRFCSFL